MGHKENTNNLSHSHPSFRGWMPRACSLANFRHIVISMPGL
jgi:hypothetical protein